ncbi:MAG: DUF4037 domain-containing protein [Candidatus Binataceae bacterium]
MEFIAGLQLNEMFYREAVAPILNSAFPDLRYSAARIGPGSEVLGYDSERSTDHGWGPGVTLFLATGDREEQGARISSELSAHLPVTFRGYSTGYDSSPRHGTRTLEPAERGRVNHDVQVASLPEFLRAMLGIEPAQPLRAADWLLMPQQALLEVTAGRVFHDGLGELVPIREKLAWYPHDVWLYLLASQWMRIAQEEPFVGRCAEAGDELGSRLVAGRIVRDLMRLCFLVERRYAPYSKWLGTGFARLNCASELGPILSSVMAAANFAERERHLCAGYEVAARMHNQLGITAPIDANVRRFHDRPYLVIDAERFAKRLIDALTDAELKQIYSVAGPIGGIDQFADNTNLLGRTDLRARLRALFTAA